MPRYHPFVGNINPISQREGNLLYWLKDACRCQVLVILVLNKVILEKN